MFMLEAYSRLANAALTDAGVELSEVDGLLVGGVPESRMFGPSAVAEYLGTPANFAETVDFGGASGAGQLWRAVAAMEAGVCDTCVCMLATVPAPRDPDATWDPSRAYIGADAWGAPHGQFDIPYGLVNPNAHFAMVAQRYMHEYEVTAESLAKIAVHEVQCAVQRQGRFSGTADHDRGCGQSADDRGSAAPAGDRDAVPRRSGHRRDDGGTSEAVAESAGLPDRLWKARDPQVDHVLAPADADSDQVCGRSSVRDGGR